MKSLLKRCFSSPKWLLSGVCALGLATPSQALIIDFEAPSYTANTPLNGNGAAGGTHWTTGGNGLMITPGAGIGGSQALVLKNPSAASDASTFQPSVSDLPGFNAASSLVRLDFSFRFVETPSTSTSPTNIAYLQIGNAGSSPAARITFYDNGTLGYHINRANPVNITPLSFQATDTLTWYNASVLLNYGTGTYSFSVNGIELTAAGVFRGSGHNDLIRFLTFQGDNHREIAFDQLSLQVIPEPATIGFLLGGAGLIAGGRRFRRTNCAAKNKS